MIANLRRFKRLLKESVRQREHAKVYTKFRDLTMVSANSYAANLEVVEQAATIKGCVVECGVWRGGMSGGIATVLGPDRKYYLFDSFEGLPPAKEIDGKAAVEWQQNTEGTAYYDNCSAGEDYAKEAMRRAGAHHFELIKGWFDKTVPNFAAPEPIAVLRLDGDWYESTKVCLDHLFFQVAPGGLVILDDYHCWDGCSRALHDFLSERKATERIRSLGNVCYLVRRNPQDA